MDNDINLEQLKSIYEDDGGGAVAVRAALKDMGITSYGHQHQIIEALEALLG